MLWYKGWLETRFRLLFGLGVIGLVLVSGYSKGLRPPTSAEAIVGIAKMSALAFSLLLAGAGVATQPSFQATKGLHGSMLFTLSMPASRFRLLAVRASLGWLEMAAGIGITCCGIWFRFPLLRGAATPEGMLRHAVVLVACASALYSISVLLATFLDDQWRIWGSMLIIGALWWFSSNAPLPASFDIFRAMGEGSPLFTHTMPWTAIVISIGLATILFFTALKVVRTREY